MTTGMLRRSVLGRRSFCFCSMPRGCRGVQAELYSMHIVFLDFVTHYGGAQRSMVEFAGRLAKHTKVSVIDPYGCCKEFREAVRRIDADYHVLIPEARSVVVGAQGERLERLWRVACSLPGLFKVRSRVVRVLQQIRATVVCSVGAKSMLMAAPSLKLRKLPMVGYLRTWCLPDTIPPYALWLYKRRCSALFALSEPTKAALRCSGIDPNKIVVLHNPMDVETLLAEAEMLLERELPQTERPVRLLVAASLLRTKGQHTAVRALRRITDEGCDAVLWPAGNVGIGGDMSYVSETKQLAADLCVSDRVEWLGMRSDIPQMMKAATMVLQPSYSEGLGRSVMEAMVLGRPVAATRVGGVADLILPGVTGLVFEVDDDAGLANCILRAVNDPIATARLVEQAREYVQTNPRFTSAYHTATALKVFRHLSDNGR